MSDPSLRHVFSPKDTARIRAELAKHEAIQGEKLTTLYGPRELYGPINNPTNVIDIFTGKVIR